MNPPLVVCDGMGQDSSGLLVGMKQRGVVPDLILFANVGAERPETYKYRDEVRIPWLKSVGFPPLTEVRYVPRNFKHWPHYHTIEENCWTNSTLPSIAYGFHSCSSKWKIAPQNKFLDAWQPAQDAWKAGVKVTKCIGFDASPHELRRASGCSTYAVQDDETEKYNLTYPLQEWGWTRERCIQALQEEGLPIPPKSSCYFCTAMKTHEVDGLGIQQMYRIVIIEHRASERNLKYARARFDKLQESLLAADEETRPKLMAQLKGMAEDPSKVVDDWIWNGRPLTEGLWRKATRGLRKGTTARPGSITQYLMDKGHLSPKLVTELQKRTPTGALTKDDIQAWQPWVENIIDEAVKAA